jgi:hypothetical protein
MLHTVIHKLVDYFRTFRPVAGTGCGSARDGDLGDRDREAAIEELSTRNRSRIAISS